MTDRAVTAEEARARRNALAEILLHAVLASGVTERGYPAPVPVTVEVLGARRWLTANPIADLYFRLLDIDPEAAGERLRRTWAKGAAAHGGCTQHG